jgi:O-antigen/teichoic acid export membrane protein
MTTPPELWRRSGSNLAASVIDQGLVSAPSFALNLLLGRALSAEGYGAFATGFAVLTVGMGFHAAFVVEPMSVKGAIRAAESRGRYLGTLALVHLLCATPLALGFLAVGALAGVHALGPVFVALALTFPSLTLFWLLRSACYLDGKPAAALRGSATYGTVLLLPTIVLHRAGRLSPASALLVIAGAAALGSLVLWRRLGVRLMDVTRRGSTDALGSVLREHWRFGRWIIAAAAASSLAHNLYVPVVGGVLGLAQGGAYRAMQVFTAPLAQVMQAAGMLALPWLSRRASLDPSSATRAGGKLLVLGGALAAGYGALLALVGPALVHLVYRSSYFDQHAWLIRFFAAVLVATTLAQLSGILLRAYGFPDGILWSKLAAVVVLLGAGLPLVWKLGLRGAAWGSILVPLAEATAALLLLARRRPPEVA